MAEEQTGEPRRGRRAASSEKRTLPHNLAAEASILGGLILHNEYLDRVEQLDVDAFYDHKHKIVFAAMRSLAAAGKPFDVVTLEAEIERAGKLDAVGGVAFLGDLCLRVPTPDNVSAYARIVTDHHLLRELALRASRALERVYDWPYQADELLGETMADFERIARGHREASERIPIITIADSLVEIERLSRTPIYETPFPDLNRTLGFGGFLAGQVYYLAGGTGFGKTSFLGALVKHHSAQGRPSLIAFYEMFAGYYTARMAAGLIGVHANRILRNEIDAASIVRALPKQIEMLEAPSMALIRRAAERQIRIGHGAPLIVVDYLQLLGDRILATMARPDARIANAQASAGLRELAKETGAAVVVVSAAGRSASRALNKDVRKLPARDLIDASRESGAIEFDSAGVIVLSVSDERDGDEQIATITVAKARFGETRHIDARTDGRTGSWREIGLISTVPRLDPKPDDGAVRAAIVAVIAKYGPQGSKSQIHKLSGKNKTAILSEIDAMMSDRSMVYAEGKYALQEGASGSVPEPQQQPIPGVG